MTLCEREPWKEVLQIDRGRCKFLFGIAFLLVLVERLDLYEREFWHEMRR